MPRKSRITREGRNLLRGKRFDVVRKGPREPKEEKPPNVMLPDGTILNEWESIVYRALMGMKVPFRAQASLGGGATLGGASVDFLVEYPKVAIEVQGPFHDTAEGKVRDWYRNAVREQYGYRPVYIYQNDLPNIHQRLREVLGWAA